MLNFIVLFFLMINTSCQKDEIPVIKNNNTSDDPAQYGTPFLGVPDARDAVIYQVNTRVFSQTRNFQGVIARLDSIKALGVNVIYLMPIYPVGQLKAINSPYAIKDYKSVSPEFGNLDDLRKLVDGAHSRNMAVILDWVGNHTSWDHSWMSNSGWYVKDNSGNIISPNGWNDVAQLNFNNGDMRQAMIKAMKYWVLAANCDGFRCDYSDGPPVDFWEQADDTLRKMSNRKLLMLAEGTKAESYSAGFNYTFGFRFYDQLKNVFSNNQPASSLYTLNNTEYTGADLDDMVVRYITNHDVNSSDGTPLDLFGGNKGSMAAFIVAAYMKGVPMIYNGQEVGTPNRLSFPFTGPVINWSLNPAMVSEYKKLIAFRNNNNAIRRGTLTTFPHHDLCVFTKTSGSETVLVISNLRNTTVNYTLPSTIGSSSWYDAFTANPVALGTSISVAPHSYIVLKK